MNAPFRLYGADTSPYAAKVRAYLRFKGLEFTWLNRSQARQQEYARYAKQNLSPLLVDAADNVLQDSTPTIEKLEQLYPEPSIVPADPALAFIAALIEDYADEWLSKAMFHYRWTYPEDQDSAARRIADMLYEGAEAPAGVVESIKTRMSARLHHVGSSPDAAPLIEGSFAQLVEILERMLARRPYLLGGRPCIADFGLAAQLGQLLADPTPGALIKARAANVAAWVKRMEDARVEGEFASLEALGDDLAALLQQEIAGAYLAWMAANAQAVAEDASGVSVMIGGRAFTQKPQRLAAKAFNALRAKRGAVEREDIAALLGSSGCDAFLLMVSGEADETPDGDDGGED
ncbi:MAG: glutathione S-transferase family protein [Alphaproteobacteria bacterium]